MTVVSDYTALLSGSYWNGIEVTGNPVIVTFSFPSSLPAYDTSINGFSSATYSTFTPFTATEQAQAIQALGEWAAASGIIFVEVAPGQGDINFGNVDFSTTSYAGAGGIGFYPFGDWNYYSYPFFSGDLSTSGDIFMNSQFINPDGSVNYGTLLHEIGHAIGLKHPTEIVTDYAANPIVTHDQVLSSDDASRTVMATVGDSEESDPHLLQLDKDAAAYIYGPAGAGGVYTNTASGSNSVASWSWNSTTQTLTQTATTVDDTIRGTSVKDIIYGSSADDKLFGLSGNDQLFGYGGNDALYGGAGTNLLEGGAGDDSYYVSSSTDTIVEGFNEGYDIVYATANFTLPDNVEALFLSGQGLTGVGNNAGDVIFGDGFYGSTLIGGTGSDYIVGGAGSDVIKGGGGVDLMFGEDAGDTFVFTSVEDAPVGNNRTTIGDFTDGEDKIDLSAIKTQGATPGQSLYFVGNASFSHHAGEVHQIPSGADTVLEGDTDGDGLPDFQIMLAGTHNLQAGDLILTSTPCYCAGTLIKTPQGDVAVETLAIGDEVVTLNGENKPIKWIGRRSYSGYFLKGRKDALPVCFKAGSLAVDSPQRDLWISPHHAMFLEGVLIEARDLVNGTTIAQVDDIDHVEYFHIELDKHEVIFAEGAPSETFIDDDSRNVFHNVLEFAELYPNEPHTSAQYYAPRCGSGFAVEAARRKIARLAATNAGAENIPPAGPLRGHVDSITPQAIAGWVQDEAYPDVPICLEIYTNDDLIGRVLANHYRSDLKMAGLGSGFHGFSLTLTSDHALRGDLSIRRASDGASLPLPEERIRLIG